MAHNTGDDALVTTTNYIQFNEGLTEAMQQRKSIFEKYFEIQDLSGEFGTLDRIGMAPPMTPDIVRKSDNPDSSVSYDRRLYGTSAFHVGTSLDPKDFLTVVTNPTSSIVSQYLNTVQRQKDDIIIGSMFADVQTKLDKSGTISFAPTTSGKITVGEYSKGNGLRPISDRGYWKLQAGDVEGIDVALNFVERGSPANSGLTLAKLNGLRQTMLEMDVIEPEDPIFLAIGPAQYAQLLHIEEVVNKNYDVAASLRTYSVTPFMNFVFVLSKRLKGAGTAEDPRQCIAFTRHSGIIAKRYERARSWALPNKKNIPYFLFELNMGFVRQWGEHTARVNCLD